MWDWLIIGTRHNYEIQVQHCIIKSEDGAAAEESLKIILNFPLIFNVALIDNLNDYTVFF